MPRIPYYEVENATGKHAELLGKLNPDTPVALVLERLQTIRKSWFGILEIEIDLPESLLKSPERNAALVQTIEEFAANSFRHGKATAIKVSAVSSSVGLKLTLHSNGSGKISPKRGLGSEWIDQISLTPWKLRRTSSGTTLEITL
mgnify:CR=1 FL=1